MSSDGKHLAKYQFKPGQSGNKSGRRPLPEHLRDAPELTKDRVQKMIGLYAEMSLTQLEEKAKDKTLPGFEAAIVATLIKAIKDGDVNRMEFFLNRCGIGKVTDKVETNLKVEEVEVTKENIAELYEIARKA